MQFLGGSRSVERDKTNRAINERNLKKVENSGGKKVAESSINRVCPSEVLKDYKSGPQCWGTMVDDFRTISRHPSQIAASLCSVLKVRLADRHIYQQSSAILKPVHVRPTRIDNGILQVESKRPLFYRLHIIIQTVCVCV